MATDARFEVVLGRGGMINWISIADGDRELFEDWYTAEHLPERVSTPGFLRARRFVADDRTTPGLTDFLTLYETVDVGVLASPEYLRRLDTPTELTRRVVPLFRDFRRCAATLSQSHGAGSSGRVLAVEIDADSVSAWRVPLSRLLPRLVESHVLLSASLYEPDRAVGDAKAATSEGRSSTRQRSAESSLLLLEPQGGTTAAQVAAAIHAEADDARGISTPRWFTLLVELRSRPTPTTTPYQASRQEDVSCASRPSGTASPS